MLPAGIALQAIGTGIKNSIPKFNTGVENFGGGLSYVHQGEMLVNLANGTSVIPKHLVNSSGIIGGGF